MLTQNNGGPAFPLYEEGMTLRDWFAGMALSNPAICKHDDDYPHRTAYSFADAMIEARKK